MRCQSELVVQADPRHGRGRIDAQQEFSLVVTAVFRTWHSAAIPFLVLRNYENLPGSTTNDIDVLVEPGQLRRAEQTLVAAADSAGFRLHNRAEFAPVALYFSSRRSGAQVHFDLFTALKWRGFDFLCCEEFLGRRMDRGLFAVPHPAHEAASNLLSSMIFIGNVKDKYKASIAAGVRAEQALATQLLSRSFGPSQARFLAAAAAQESWLSIEARAGALRRTLILRQLTRRPWVTARSLLHDARRLAGRLIRPPGLTVVLCGADGSGEPTAARALIEGLDCTFSPLKGRYYDGKSALFAREKSAAHAPATNPHGQPLRGPSVSVLHFAFHWLELFLGSHLRFRPVTFRNGLVLIDRFYYDFFFDQQRYRLRVPQILVRLGYLLLKKPDLVLLLGAPADLLESRSQEVTLVETQRQRQAYRDFVEGLSQGRIVDAAQSPEKLAADLEQVVLDFMAQRAMKRWGRDASSL